MKTPRAAEPRYSPPFRRCQGDEERKLFVIRPPAQATAPLRVLRSVPPAPLRIPVQPRGAGEVQYLHLIMNRTEAHGIIQGSNAF